MDAAADGIGQDLYTTVGAEDGDTLRRCAASGLVVHRRDGEFSTDVAGACDILSAARLPGGYTIASAADVNEAALRRLDDTLRQDVPGSAGWINDPREFHEDAFMPVRFDPSTYLVAVDASGAAVGLVRIWRSRPPLRLGAP